MHLIFCAIIAYQRGHGKYIVCAQIPMLMSRSQPNEVKLVIYPVIGTHDIDHKIPMTSNCLLATNMTFTLIAHRESHQPPRRPVRRLFMQQSLKGICSGCGRAVERTRTAVQSEGEI